MDRRRRVLVVDDNGDHALTIKLLLEYYGFDVAVAGDGELGLAVARRWTPNFVLLDIGLPGIDGYEVAQSLQSDPQTANVKIIGMSAYDPGQRPERERAARFAVRLVKPVPAETLLSALA
jgi:CheY-like chemotaxis protein